MADFTINFNGTDYGGLDKYNPTKLAIVKNAGRNISNGEAFADFIANKVTIELNFRNRTEAQAAALETELIPSLSNYFFTVIYDDNGTPTTSTFYRSPIKKTANHYYASTGEFTWDISFTIIEK